MDTRGAAVFRPRQPHFRVLLSVLAAVLSIAGFQPIAFPTAIFGTEPEATSEHRWSTEVHTGRFRIHCDFELTSQDALIRELHGVQQDLKVLLKQPRRQQPIHIVLFETESEYLRYMQNYFPQLPRRRALFLQDRGPGMLFTHWHAEVATDLRHEVTHALLNHRNRSLPLWLDEGIAEYFEVAPAERFRDCKYVRAVQHISEQGGIQSLRSLANITQLEDFGDSEYRDSWAWIHFLMHRNAQTRSLLVRYLQDYHSQPAAQVTLTGHDKPAVAQSSQVQFAAHREPSPISPQEMPAVHGTDAFDLERALRSIFPDLEREFTEHFLSLGNQIP